MSRIAGILRGLKEASNTKHAVRAIDETRDIVQEAALAKRAKNNALGVDAQDYKKLAGIEDEAQATAQQVDVNAWKKVRGAEEAAHEATLAAKVDIAEKMGKLTPRKLDQKELDQHLDDLAKSARDNNLIDASLVRADGKPLSGNVALKVLENGGTVTPQEMLSIRKHVQSGFEEFAENATNKALNAARSAAKAGTPSATSDALKWPARIALSTATVAAMGFGADKLLFDGDLSSAAKTKVVNMNTATQRENAEISQDQFAARVKECQARFAVYGELTDTCIKPSFGKGFESLRDVFEAQQNEPARMYVQKLGDNLQVALKESKGDPSVFQIKAEAARLTSVKEIEGTPEYKGAQPNFKLIDTKIANAMGWE